MLLAQVLLNEGGVLSVKDKHVKLLGLVYIFNITISWYLGIVERL